MLVFCVRKVPVREHSAKQPPSSNPSHPFVSLCPRQKIQKEPLKNTLPPEPSSPADSTATFGSIYDFKHPGPLSPVPAASSVSPPTFLYLSSFRPSALHLRFVLKMPVIVRTGDPKLLLPLGPASRCFAAVSEDEISIISVAADGTCFETAQDIIDADAVGGLGAMAAAHCNGILWVISRDIERPCIGVLSAWEVRSDGGLRRLRAADTCGHSLCIYTPNAPFSPRAPPHLDASASQLLLTHPLHGVAWSCSVAFASGGGTVRQTSPWRLWGPFDTSIVWAASAAGRVVAIVPTVGQPTMAEVNGDEEAQPATCNLLLAPPDSHSASRRHGSAGGSDGVMLHSTLLPEPVLSGVVLSDDGSCCTLLLLTPQMLQLVRVDCCTGGALQPSSSVPMSSLPLPLLQPSAVPQPPQIIASIPIGQGGVAKGPVTCMVTVARLPDDGRPPSLLLIWQVLPLCPTFFSTCPYNTNTYLLVLLTSHLPFSSLTSTAILSRAPQA